MNGAVVSLTGLEKAYGGVGAVRGLSLEVGAGDLPGGAPPSADEGTLERAIENRQHKEENNSLRRALSTMSGGSAPVFQSYVVGIFITPL